MDETQLLADRLQRVTVAMAMTEDILADTLERRARLGGPEASSRRLAAKRCRAAADECRSFSKRLAQIRSTEPGGSEESLADD